MITKVCIDCGQLKSLKALKSVYDQNGFFVQYKCRKNCNINNMERPIKKDFMVKANQFTFDEYLNKYYAALEAYATDLERQIEIWEESV